MHYKYWITRPANDEDARAFDVPVQGTIMGWAQQIWVPCNPVVTPLHPYGYTTRNHAKTGAKRLIQKHGDRVKGIVIRIAEYAPDITPRVAILDFETNGVPPNVHN